MIAALSCREIRLFFGLIVDDCVVNTTACMLLGGKGRWIFSSKRNNTDPSRQALSLTRL